MKRTGSLIICLAAALWAAPARAADGGTDAGDMTDPQDLSEADLAPLTGIQPSTTPDPFSCSMAPAHAHAHAHGVAALAVMGLLALAVRRRRTAIVCAALAASAPATAAQQGDDIMQDAPLSHPRGKVRRVALSYNPLTPLIDRYGINIEILPVSHHVIILSPFYASTTTNADSYHNTFRGGGGEIGYRYYLGHDGPRGFYVGPSLLLGWYDAIPGPGVLGNSVSFYNLGGALDAGWQAIVAERWVVGIGAGVQYTNPSVSFPRQELPAAIYANRGVHPRLLTSIGVAF